MKVSRDILFVYPTGKNKEFVQKIAAKKNQTVSFVVNFLIDNFKADKQMQSKIEKKTPVYIKKSEENLKNWKAKQALHAED